MVTCSCCFGVAGLAPAVAVPTANTVTVDWPVGVLATGVGVGVGGGGCCVPPPPQLITVVSNKRVMPAMSARRRWETINTIPTAKSPPLQTMAFMCCCGRNGLGESNSALGPLVLSTRVVWALLSRPPTGICAGINVQVVSGGNGPQLKLKVPVKPLREDASILNAADWPARIFRKVLPAPTA